MSSVFTFPICPACEGAEIVLRRDVDGNYLGGDEPCPSCGGLGAVISDEMVEAGVESRLWGNDDLENARHAVRGILAAVVTHLKEGNQ